MNLASPDLGRRDPRPRVLHLAFEDPRQPGAGGGSVRTAEMNARLAEHFRIVVVMARYPGCVPYTADGVRYLHAGLPGHRTASIMSYFAAQADVVARYRPDLVVEDFGAPLSSIGLPRLTRRPVVGVVQWLFADEKSREYHMPLAHVERFGVRSHRTLVAVSDDLAARLRTVNPRADVRVVPNGLPDAAFVERAEAPTGGSGGLRYLGRLEDAQKGINLLLEAYARVAARIPQDLLIAGEGPDGPALTALADRLGVAHRVRFVGPIPREARFDWLAGADVVVMPSRYETFGMVAAEALAVGRPVVAFDIPCLRSLVSDRTGRRVAAFDVDAFAGAVEQLCSDDALRAQLGRAGHASVRHLTWDQAAADQAAVYADALARRQGRRNCR